MDVIGGGVLVAVAAALWIAYLLPSWFRRRQYLAEERNVVRLQQALRVIAETSETPETVEVEVTAREVARQERIAREHERELEREAELRAAAEAEAEAAAAREARLAAEERAAAARAAEARAARAAEAHVVQAPVIAEPEPEPAGEESPGLAPVPSRTPAARRAARRIRRRRAASTLGFLASTVALVVGLALLATPAGPWVAAAGATGMVAAVAGLVVLARAKPRPEPVVAAPAEAQPFEPFEFEAEPVATEAWTPQPLPKPLTLSRGTIAATVMASIEEAERLKRAAADAELAQRAAALEPAPPRLDEKRRAEAAAAAAAAEAAAVRAAEAEAAPPSRYARMGIVGDAQPGIDDLDAVLRRRRTAG